ncbi:transcription factor 25, putative [Babesia ovata]|uniref:Transcription factor 25, putative n=1 Tax=Babesia ovata TaxID=189622 RepID=A0A2H6KHW1_9APIC|nr:transcription factor 25, putative [Babesia ovata]GBE62559.1 transcription factor 25, putative [Babesia ovata]
MSTRQIRRLQRDREREKDEYTTPPPKVVINVNQPRFSFSMLRDALDSDEESSSDSEEDSSSEADSSSSSSEHEESVTCSTPDRNIQTPQDGNKGDDGSPEPQNADEDTDEDSDMQLLESYKEQTAESADADASANKEKRFECLRIEPRAFRVVGVDTRASGKTRMGKGFGGYLQGRNWLVPGVPPKLADKYRAVVGQHMRLKGTYDAKSERERFTLELSERLKFAQGNHEDAFKAISFAIKLFQAALPPRFSPFRLDEKGYYNTWLPSYCGSNLVAYRLLLLYMICLERQAQWEACLAVCKLMLLMDFPNDVAHALLHIDLYLLNHSGIGVAEFAVGYAKAVEYAVPLYWVLPNFAFSMALEFFAKETKESVHTPISESYLDLLQQFLMLQEDRLGFRFNPVEQDMGIYADKRSELCLIRALVQYPDMIRMLARENFAADLVVYTEMEPFASWMSDYDTDDVHLIKCYLAKTGDLWRHENLSFLINTAGVIAEIYRTERGATILGTFRDLWSAFRLEQPLPLRPTDVIVAEFDLTSHSLPTALE